MKYGFIGCGNMGGALAKAVSQADASNEIFLADLNTAMMNTLAEKISDFADPVSVAAVHEPADLGGG